MTPSAECLAKVATLFADYADDLLMKDGRLATAAEAAEMAAEIVREDVRNSDADDERWHG
jgi:hypothetical protein